MSVPTHRYLVDGDFVDFVRHVVLDVDLFHPPKLLTESSREM